MTQKIRVATLQLSAVLLILTVVFARAMPMAVAQNAPSVSLEEQLKARYKLVKIETATGEITITEPGTVLAIRKGGIIGVVPKSLAISLRSLRMATPKGRTILAVEGTIRRGLSNAGDDAKQGQAAPRANQQQTPTDTKI